MMKKIMRIVLPLLLILAIIGSIGWYLFSYDRGFTRDVLLQQARFHDLHGNSRMSSWFYDLAYNFSGRDGNVAIELANQYKSSGNYTKAESTLTNAIKQGGTPELYTALSKTFAEQDKLLDSVALLDQIQDPQVKAQLDAMRPQAPVPDQAPGFFSQYIDVALSAEGTIYYRTDGEYPTTADAPYGAPIHLGTGETLIQAIAIAPNGLVSPLAELQYTVGGVVEPVTLEDPAINAVIRELLEKSAKEQLYTNDLWKIEEFTVPQEAKSFEDLAKIPYLRKLTMQGFQLENLDFLLSSSRLKILDLTGCTLKPESLSALATLPALQELVLAETGLSSIAGLEQVTGLTKLDLHNNTVRNLEVLSGMPKLRQLNLSHNAVTDLTPLGGLTDLDRLDVSFNALTTLAPLGGCIKLTQIEAGNNQITDLSGVAGLSLLTYLGMDYNQLTDLSPIAPMIQLATLKVSNNQLTDLSPLADMTALDALYFSHNQVEALPAWPNGGELRIIDGSNNLLANMDGLAKMEKLSYVYLDYNALTSIDALKDCYKLVQVNVYGNDIKDVSALTEQDVIVNYDPT